MRCLLPGEIPSLSLGQSDLGGALVCRIPCWRRGLGVAPPSGVFPGVCSVEGVAFEPLHLVRCAAMWLQVPPSPAPVSPPLPNLASRSFVFVSHVPRQVCPLQQSLLRPSPPCRCRPSHAGLASLGFSLVVVWFLHSVLPPSRLPPREGRAEASSRTASVLAQPPRSLASVIPSVGLPPPKERVEVVVKSGNRIIVLVVTSCIPEFIVPGVCYQCGSFSSLKPG